MLLAVLVFLWRLMSSWCFMVEKEREREIGLVVFLSVKHNGSGKYKIEFWRERVGLVVF